MKVKNTGVAILLGTLLPCFVLGSGASKEYYRNGILFDGTVVVEKDEKRPTDDFLKDSLNLIRIALESELTRRILQKALLTMVTGDTPKLQDEVLELPNNIGNMSKEVKHFNELMNFENKLFVDAKDLDKDAKANRVLIAGNGNGHELDDHALIKYQNPDILFDNLVSKAIGWWLGRFWPTSPFRRLTKEVKPQNKLESLKFGSIAKLLNDTFSSIEDEYIIKLPTILRAERNQTIAQENNYDIGDADVEVSLLD